MSLISTLGKLKRVVISSPPIINIRRRQFNHEFEFAENVNLFRGVFSTFKAAQDALPETKPTGYDNNTAASMYKDRIGVIYDYDYPVLFWLEKLNTQDTNYLLDFGGHIGLSYYSHSKALSKKINWQVYDLPAVVKEGRKFASGNDEQQCLSFIDHLSQAKPSEFFLASGSLQYLEEDLVEILQKLPQLPPYVMINMLPVTDTQSFYTVQSIGTAFCPYRIFNGEEMVRHMSSIGYTLVDRWQNHDKGCHIAFHDHKSLSFYTGFLFKLA